MDFKKEYQQEFAIDHEYELYVQAWEVYHKTADQIDGHIKYPITKDEYNLTRVAGKSAIKAQEDFMYMMGILKPCPKSSPESWKKWQQAKLEALRRLEPFRKS